MVFLLSHQASKNNQGYKSTFVSESEPHGIDIHPVDKYLDDESGDIAILRLPEGSLPSDIWDGFMRRVRGFALEEIDATYGYGHIARLVERVLGRRVGSFMNRIFDILRLWFGKPGVAKDKKVNEWICSGVVQHAYYRACFGAGPAVGEMWNPYFDQPSNRAKVVVNPDLRVRIESGVTYSEAEEELKLTTPAHFALAATYGNLYTVAVRIGGVWGNQLARK